MRPPFYSQPLIITHKKTALSAVFRHLKFGMMRSSLLDLAESLDAAGAIHLGHPFFAFHHMDFLEIGEETPLRMALGETHVVAYLSGFPAVSTLCHVLLAS